jgi:MFS family permease
MIPLRRNRDFVALWVGQAVSNLGISISSFAYPLVVLEVTHSAVKAGAVGSVLTATTFVVRLPAGALVDRLDRRRLMIVCDAARATASSSLAAAIALGHFRFAHVLVVAFVEGSMGTVFGPAESAAVRLAVAPEQRREAVALNQSRSQVPGVVGPPLGGALLAAGRSLPFVADAISYLVSLTAILMVRSPYRETQPAPRSRHVLADALDGVRWLWAQPFLRALLVWMSFASFALASIGLVILVYARDRGGSPGELGVMFALTSAGGVAGAVATPVILRRIRPRRLILAFSWLFAGMTATVLALSSPYAIGVAGGVAFLAAPALGALLFSSIATDAPDELQGRATSGAIQIAGLATPVAPLAAGLLVAHAGARTTLALYAGFAVLLALAAASSRRLGEHH